MTESRETGRPAPPLALDGAVESIVTQGLSGLTLEEQLSAFCQRVHDSGFPMKRANMGIGTLHPRYGAHTFVWRPGLDAVEHIPRERTMDQLEAFKRSPIYYMRSRNETLLRRRLDGNEPLEFEILDELREEGMTEYAARLVPFGAVPHAAPEPPTARFDPAVQMTGAFAGVFFSCATEAPGGFDDAELQQVGDMLPFLALSVKSRATYDVASTVIETYLGEDAGHRVLTGEIQRGSVEAIRAVIWFCDLRGFTRLTDTLPRDQVIDVLDDYLEAMATPVHENRGQILKFLGDGFLATFDLTALEDEAVCMNALKAAAELRATIPDFNAAREAAGKPTMDFGLALHLGDVLYGNIGASERLDFTVVGPAVNEASRIQALCRPLGREILISNAFHEIACACHGGLVSLGFHGLRGVREPQELFTLAG